MKSLGHGTFRLSSHGNWHFGTSTSPSEQPGERRGTPAAPLLTNGVWRHGRFLRQVIWYTWSLHMNFMWLHMTSFIVTISCCMLLPLLQDQDEWSISQSLVLLRSKREFHTTTTWHQSVCGKKDLWSQVEFTQFTKISKHDNLDGPNDTNTNQPTKPRKSSSWCLAGTLRRPGWNDGRLYENWWVDVCLLAANVWLWIGYVCGWLLMFVTN